ncbi:hypothetical protein [Streptomyces sp. NPDC037389]
MIGLRHPCGQAAGTAAALTARSGGCAHTEQYQDGCWPGVTSHHMAL